MIEVQALTKHYGPVTAIRDVSFSVAPGTIVGFLGPNGAGKSTTMRILSCFMPASSGTARVAGYDVFRDSLEVRKRIGYLPENVPLYTDMRVAPYLDFVAEVKGVPRGQRKARVAEVMDRCLIADVQNRLIGALSKGYRQRVGLAQAIVNDPQVLILDEPTIGLDPKQITEIRALIKSLTGSHTVILSTHILPEVSMVCGSVIIINKGAIVAQGSIDTLVEQFFPVSRVQVQIGGPAGAVRDGLSSIPGVLAVAETTGDGAGGYLVEAAPRARRAHRDLPPGRGAGVGAEGTPARGDHPGGSVHAHRGGRGGAGRWCARRAGRGRGRVKVWPIFKKEMRLYFTSPTAYVVIAVFLILAGYFFFAIFDFFTRASLQTAMNPQMGRDLNITDNVLRPLFSNVSVILLLLMPLVTMRLFAEERRSGTIELLLTYPVRDGAVLLGKFLAALALYGVMLVLTLLYPALLFSLARPEWGPILTGYLGLLLLGAAFIAAGLFASSLTENQIVAAMTTFGILLLFWVISWTADSVGGSAGRVLTHLSLIEHFDNFGKGVLDTRDIIYYLSFIIFALFLTLRSLEARRWKG